MKRLLATSVLAFMAAATNLHAESINVLVEGGGEQLQKDIAAKFTKDTGIDVKFTVVPYQGVFDKLSASMASGKSDYDVATIDVVWNAKFADKVENLDSLFTPEVVADLPTALLADAKVKKIFHFARFDVAAVKQHLGVDTNNIYCTKIASRLARTYTDRHGLKDLVKELLGIELDKQQQSSDWGAHVLSEQQKKYAAQDVLYLHELKARLDQMLEREGRMLVAQACFEFLPTRAALDLMGWPEEDVFAHS